MIGTLERRARSGRPWDELLRGMALCSDVHIEAGGAIVGDPTEVALVTAARDAGYEKNCVWRRNTHGWRKSRSTPSASA